MSYFPNQGQTTSARSQSIVPASDSPQFPTGNLVKQFRTACESTPPVQDWTTTTAPGDIVTSDGNTQGASYWVISKSPFELGSETIIDGLQEFDIPSEFSFGLHRSQAALGQEFSIEVVDTATPAAPTAEVSVSALSQSATTLTITTATDHGLVAGQSIGIYGCADSRFNYGALVVARVNGPTQIEATAGPGGTIPSITASPAVLGSPMLYVRRRMGGSADGTSMIFENTTATNASFYSRCGYGDSSASGTAAGNQSVTSGTTASLQPITSPNAFCFAPTTEFKLNLESVRLQWFDQASDASTSSSIRFSRGSVLPSPDKNYKIRIRANNVKGLTRPIGRIVSAVKSGSTTATITFAEAHNLTVDDYLVGYGVRDQTAAGFANLTTAAKVASIVSPTVITIVWGSTGTVTSYGGYMSRIQGGSAQAGAVTQSIQSVGTGGTGLLSVVFNTTVSGLVAGDFVEIYGVRNSTNGADVGVDGVYKVYGINPANGANIFLTQAPGGPVTTGVSATNCGGGAIRRTDLRVSWVRAWEYLRERVEFTSRPATDGAAALPVNVATASTLTVSLAPSISQGASLFNKLISANSTNLTTIRATAVTINSLNVTNTNATNRYWLKIWNQATAPTVGTTAPTLTIGLDPNKTTQIDMGSYNMRLSTGCYYAITANPADTDATAIPANEVVLAMVYT
jgi:hypothetical protein